MFEDLINGAEDSEDALKKMSKHIIKMKLKNLEDAGKIMDGMSDAFEDAEKDGSDFAKTTLKAQKDMTDLADAIKAYSILADKSTKGTKEYDAALSTLATYTGTSAESLVSNLSPALALLNADAEVARNTIISLAQGLFATAGSSFNAANWSGGLIQLANDASTADKNMASLINTMLQAVGARISATLSADGLSASINVTGLNTGSQYSGSRTPNSTSGSGGGGGGGGGGKKTNANKDEQRFVEHMDFALDLIEDAIERNDEIMSRYETQGYLTGVINQLEQEEEFLKKKGALLEENLAKLDKEIKAKQAQIAKEKAGTKAYDDLLSELEELQDAYQEYSLELEENTTELVENAEAIKKQKDAIRDLEIDLRKELLKAIEDREEREEDLLDAMVEMEEEIADAVMKRYENERDEILRNSELRREALQDEIDALDKALKKRKEAADDEDKQTELMELEAQYARIVADPTRGKEALKLYDQILDLRDEIAWDAAEDEVEAQKESLEQQITSLEDYEEYIENYYED